MTEASLTPDEVLALVAQRAQAAGVRPEEYIAAFKARMQRRAGAPVHPQVFVEDPEFLNAKGTLYPEVLQAVVDISTGNWVESVLTGGIGVGKALALDTPIPTPDGWSQMGDLKTGDQVYDESGNPCCVRFAHPVQNNRPCYKIGFSDGSHIVCDESHLWLTWTKSERANWGQGRGLGGKIRTTREILADLGSRHAVQVAEPLVGKELHRRGVDPYTLGAWLGDGSSDCARIWSVDPEIIDEIGRWYVIGKQNRPYPQPPAWTVRGLSQYLHHRGLKNNKHIPSEFMRAPVEDRLSLLQGLMDTDGTIDKGTGRVEISLSLEPLARDVFELSRTLGFRPKMAIGSSSYRGKDCGLRYRIGWTPNGKGLNPFRLPRKAQHVGVCNKRESSSRWRMIDSIEPVATVPVRCITVDSETSLYLAGDALIPTHNTTIAIYVQAYQLYLLSHYEDPHSKFGLDPSSEIEIVFQSVNMTLAREVGYDRFRALIESAPYFQKQFAPDPKIRSKLVFPNRIEVKPIAGESTSALGQNVIGGVIDEMNFGKVVSNSTKSRGDDVEYDQARVLYAALARRRLTRFMRKEVVPGMVCLVSSANYRGQFLDSKVAEAREHPDRIYVYDKRVWEVKPDDYCGETFPVFIGDETRKPRILADVSEVVPEDGHLVMPVPIELKSSYQSDLIGSLRDFSGVSTNAIRPFIGDTEQVAAAFGRHKSIFSSEWADLEDSLVGYELAEYPFLREPHAVHIDLAAVRDSCGLAIACVPGFLEKEAGTEEEAGELLPLIHVAGLLEIRPPRSGEIIFENVRKILYDLSERGLNLKWVSMDSWQSRDTKQQLQSRGYLTQEISVDRNIAPYEALKAAIYEGRLRSPAHDLCYRELSRLEFDAKKQKVDHQPQFSKDVADALCGVAWSVSRKREVWLRHQIPSGRQHLRAVPSVRVV